MHVHLCRQMRMFLLHQELGAGGKKSDTSEEWRNQSVEDRLEYALVRV